MERGQGWQEVDSDKYAYDTQLYHYINKGNRLIEYTQPYNGDWVSVSEAARIVDLFTDMTNVIFIRMTERPEIFESMKMNISDWRVWSTINGGEITEQITELQVDKGMRPIQDTFGKVHVNVLKDDWFAVMVDYDRCFKCDQMTGLANLIKHLNNNY
jgi:hypothetical protein